MARASALCLAALLLGGPAGIRAAEPEARVHQVVIEDFAFRPQRLTLRPGDSVEWVNLDIAPHTATAADGGWDSGELAGQASFRRTFPAAGSHAYLCAFHPHMRGEITVVAP